MSQHQSTERRWRLTAGRLAALALLLVAIAAVTWFALRISVGKVSAQIIDVSVTSDAEVQSRFSVHRPSAERLDCVIRAVGDRFEVVGRAHSEVPAGGDDSVSQSVTIRTTSRAETVEVESCTRR